MPIRKRNNELERTRRIAAIQLKDLAMVYCSTQERKFLFNGKKGLFANPNQHVQAAVELIRWHWRITLAVFCQEKNGKLTAKLYEAEPNGQYFYSELADLLSETHAEYARELNGVMDNVFGVGWYAIPRNDDINEEEAMRAFELLSWDKKDLHKRLTF